ncbi:MULTISPECIES: SAM-dependent methyltransferase [Nostocales]|uniref:Class I SAM-dependent methyltransferase n=3 Tax=Nostocales TaxID=1161 RepID=A0A8S9TDB0_9CYAN|nr:methyltransferase domain-containing protein [Tolypothrix bouteillei]KAF3889303.1 class I SAM-dependent methyltransferase [Tolypothrix bouteillei VB521301]
MRSALLLSFGQSRSFFKVFLTTVSVSSLLLASCSPQSVSSQEKSETSSSAIEVQQSSPTTETAQKQPDVVYVPTPPEVVDKMLEVAKVTKNDVLYDLGSGDGRIPITAAKKFGTRGIGIDIDPERIKEANENAKKAGVTDKVTFRQQDLFTTDFSEATVVTLYLLPELNVKLRPQLFKQLKPGTRIVSHAFDMGDWKPEKTLQVDGRTVYFWTIPAKSTTNPQENPSS